MIPYIKSGQMVSNGGGTKRYVYRNATGGRWRGMTCAACHTHKSSDTTFVTAGRSCKQCGQRTANYFRCKDCQPPRDTSYFMEAMGGVAY